jgi:thioredoxin 1
VEKLTEDTLGPSLQEGAVLLKFEAEWCGPCKKLGTVLAKLDMKFKSLDIRGFSVDIDGMPNLTAHYNIESVPTLVLLSNGKETTRKVGFAKEQDILSWVDAATVSN